MPAYLAVKAGKVRVSTSTTVSVQEWTFEIKGDPQDVTSGEHSGYGTYVGGVADGDISFTGVFDLAMSTPVTTLAPNAILSGCIFYVNDTSGASVSCSMIVSSFRINTVIRGKVNATVTGKSTGTITLTSL